MSKAPRGPQRYFCSGCNEFWLTRNPQEPKNCSVRHTLGDCCHYGEIPGGGGIKGRRTGYSMGKEGETMSLTVYLSGPITGKSFDDASDWRHTAAIELRERGFKVLDPLRGKSYVLSHQRKKPIHEHDYMHNPSLSDKALRQRDKLDVLASDIVLVNFMDAEQVSVGTVFEIAWAEDHNKLVVVAAPEKDKHHNHAFIRDTSVIFNSLEEAIRYVISCGVEEVLRD